jgi:hypothetical protein
MQSPMPLQNLRPLPATVRLPRTPAVMPRTARVCSKDMAMRAALAEDNFVGRAYPVSGIPAVGRGADGALRTSSTLVKDVKTLVKPGLKGGTRLAVAGKVTVDVDGVASFGVMTINGVRQAKHQPLLAPSTALTSLHRAGAVGSLVLAGKTLPALAATSILKTSEAVRLSRTEGASKDVRRTAWKDALYSQVGLIAMGVSVTGSVNTLATTGSLASPLTRTAQSLTTTDAFYALDKASRVLAPIADGALLVADILQLQETMKDDQATNAQKARRWFNVGIDTIKVATHFAPKSAAAKTAYTVVGVVQFGLAAYDQVQYRRDRQKKAV